MLEKRYKYLYEIKQTNPKPGEAIYYRGSRISKVPPEQDFWINYFTSSKLVKKKIEEEGVDAFEIVEIKPMPEDCNILYEEHLYLTEVDARNNPDYFNQHNNEGYDNPETGRRVCPFCYHKNYGNPFEPCYKCGRIMIEYYCRQCGMKLSSLNKRCSCGYSRLDDANFVCEKCGNKLSSSMERCSCGYSRSDYRKYSCSKCGKALKGPIQRCTCGYSRFDDVKYTCRKCGKSLGSSNERCECGHSRVDEANYKCVKCGEKLNSPNQRCICGYSRIDDANYKCAKCGNVLKTAASRCSCGYSRVDDTNYTCVKCGNFIKTAASRCSCGYSRMDDANYRCPRCEASLKNATSRCQCGYSRSDKYNYKCKKCGAKLNALNERCVCGYARTDNASFLCQKCGNKLEGVFTRCSCGYSKNDCVKRYCLKCGYDIKTPAGKCGKCGITRAGYEDWKKYNPIYRLTLNDSFIFEGYKHLCAEFMENELICNKTIAEKWLKKNRNIFNPKQKSKKYPNNFKYAGLKAELIPYPVNSNDLDN